MAFKRTAVAVLALAALAAASIVPKGEADAVSAEQAAFPPTGEETFLTNPADNADARDFLEAPETEREIELDEDYTMAPEEHEAQTGHEEEGELSGFEDDDFINTIERALVEHALEFENEHEGAIENGGELDNTVEHALESEDVVQPEHEGDEDLPYDAEYDLVEDAERVFDSEDFEGAVEEGDVPHDDEFDVVEDSEHVFDGKDVEEEATDIDREWDALEDTEDFDLEGTVHDLDVDFAGETVDNWMEEIEGDMELENVVEHAAIHDEEIVDIEDVGEEIVNIEDVGGEDQEVFGDNFPVPEEEE